MSIDAPGSGRHREPVSAPVECSRVLFIPPWQRAISHSHHEARHAHAALGHHVLLVCTLAVDDVLRDARAGVADDPALLPGHVAAPAVLCVLRAHRRAEPSRSVHTAGWWTDDQSSKAEARSCARRAVAVLRARAPSSRTEATNCSPAPERHLPRRTVRCGRPRGARIAHQPAPKRIAAAVTARSTPFGREHARDWRARATRLWVEHPRAPLRDQRDQAVGGAPACASTWIHARPTR